MNHGTDAALYHLETLVDQVISPGLDKRECRNGEVLFTQLDAYEFAQEPPLPDSLALRNLLDQALKSTLSSTK